MNNYTEISLKKIVVEDIISVFKKANNRNDKLQLKETK